MKRVIFSHQPSIMKVKPPLILLILSIANLTMAAPHSAIDPMPRQSERHVARYNLLTERVAEVGEKATVVFVGDSITEGWEKRGAPVWEKYYAHRSALNLGIGGDRTQHVLWRFDHGHLDGLSPRAAVVLIGTNNTGGEFHTVAQVAEGVRAIVKKHRTQLPLTHIVLMAIFPRSENPHSHRAQVLLINQVIHKLADDDSMVTWLDIGSRFMDEKGVISTEIMPDYLHLSERGYGIWAEALEPVLAKILGDTPVAP